MSSVAHIALVRGEDLHQEFRVLDSDGLVVDVSSGAGVLSAACESSAILADLSLDVSGGSSGVFYLVGAAAETASWPVGVWRVRVWVDWADAGVNPNKEVLVSVRLSVVEEL